MEVTGTMGILWLTFQEQLGKTISSDELQDFSEGWRKTTNLLGGLEHEFHFSIYHGCSGHMSNIHFPMRSPVGGFEPQL